MKSKLHKAAAQLWQYIVMLCVVLMSLFMVFAWVVILVLTVAKSTWFLLLIPLWPLDLYALGKVLDYANRKWGAK